MHYAERALCEIVPRTANTGIDGYLAPKICPYSRFVCAPAASSRRMHSAQEFRRWRAALAGSVTDADLILIFPWSVILTKAILPR